MAAPAPNATNLLRGLASERLRRNPIPQPPPPPPAAVRPRRRANLEQQARQHALIRAMLAERAAYIEDDNEDGDEWPAPGRHHHQPPMTAEMEAFLQGGANKPKIPHPAILASLQRSIVRQGDPPLDPCLVCQDVPEVGAETLSLPCLHVFHPACIEPWFKDHNSCPACRAKLPTIDDL